jgi:hypothetical protein
MPKTPVQQRVIQEKKKNLEALQTPTDMQQGETKTGYRSNKSSRIPKKNQELFLLL